MIDLRLKSFATPDQTIELPLLKAEIVELGDFTVGYVVHQPGWSWSEHVRPTVGGDWCQARHVGVLLSGRTGVRLADGTTYELGPHDVVDLPPGHDGWVIGDEPAVMLVVRPSHLRRRSNEQGTWARHAPLHRSRRFHADGREARRPSVA